MPKPGEGGEAGVELGAATGAHARVGGESKCAQCASVPW